MSNLAGEDVICARGVHGATIAEITRHAGVAQGLVNYHFGGKDQLVAALIDRWFEILIGFPQVRSGSADERLRGVIDSSLAAAEANLPLHRAVLAMQQDPAQRQFFAEAAVRNTEAAAASEDAVRTIFRERGAVDPALEEVMLRTTLEGVVIKFAALGEAYPLEEARQWVHRQYSLEA